MNILVIGQGAREHALAWKLKHSSKVQLVYVAPGNVGTALEPDIINVAINTLDSAALVAFAKENAIDLTIVGPEAPLAAGIVDIFEAEGLRCFGPHLKAAQLEASKSFSKDFMKRHQIPCAASETFENIVQAKAYLAQHSFPVVIKADGLAAGKGVVIAQDIQEAYTTLDEFMGNQSLGNAGLKVVIEEFLQGNEMSYMVITDGTHYKPLLSSQDHKRLLDQNQGPNTGGMGALSPSPLLSATLENEILNTIIEPTLKGIREEGCPFQGFLYAGIMIVQGKPFVLEYNCRLGDPETEVILLRLQSDLYEIIDDTLNGKLENSTLRWDPRPALCVILAAPGYPDAPQKGLEILGLDQASQQEVKIFHAGTSFGDRKVLTAGGRVLCVASMGHSIREARHHCYEAIKFIHFEGMQYRKDIGLT